MARLAIFLLGPPRIERDGEPVHIGRSKAVALLAYLAVEQGHHSRDVLVTLLSPELEASPARAELRRTLFVLNRELGQGWLDADRETAALNPGADVWLDVHAFGRHLSNCETHGHPPLEVCQDCVPNLEGAVQLYREDFMAGFTLRDSLPFDEWQFFQTERLKDQLASALQRLVRWYAEKEDYDRAIAYTRRRLERDVLNEAAHRELMTLYALAGQQTAALRQYELCTATLEKELGLPPAPETTELYERIRAGVVGPRSTLVPRTRAGKILPSATSLIPHNLPPQPTRFIGREEELARLEALVADPSVRLVTILGPGGIGKTRVALALAERQVGLPPPLSPPDEGPSGLSPIGKVLADARQEEIEEARAPEPRFPDGVFFVPLAGLSASDQIVPAVARALGFSFYEGREPRQQLFDYLREKRALLVLDDFDVLLSGTHISKRVDLLTEFLHGAPRLEILVTSRERLRLRQEQVYSIQGLASPERETPNAIASAAVQLFLQSAQRAQPHFDLAGDDLTHLVRICQLVEGMPLGIELAAAWVDMLSLSDIAAEIQRGLDFLETDWHDVPARHRSVRAVFDTSWQRLDEAQRDTFSQLSVFRGGFTRPAAQAVAGASLRVLVRLADKSLLRYEPSGDRYQIHELLRQYGAGALGQDPQLETAVRDRHCAYFCGWLAQREAGLKGAGQQEALAEIEADIRNVQAAWTWALDGRRLAYIDQAMGALCCFFELRNRSEEGETASRTLAERLIAAEPEGAEEQLLLAKALAWQGRFDRILGRLEIADQQLQQSLALLEGPALAGHDTRAIAALAAMPQLQMAHSWFLAEDKPRFEQNLALYEELGDQLGVAEALVGLGWISTGTGFYAEAQQHFEDSLALYREMGNHSRAVDVLDGLGWVARSLGHYDQARRLWQESIDLCRAQGNPRGVAQALRELCHLDQFQGRFEAAARLARESAALWREAGDWPGLVGTLNALGTSYIWCGKFEQAHAVLEEAAAICADLGFSNSLATHRMHQAMAKVYAGKYQEAHTQALATLKLEGPLVGEEVESGLAYRTQAWAALAEERFSDALEWAEKDVGTYRMRRDALGREWLAWSLAPLARAAFGLGDRSEAQRHLMEGLGIAVHMRAFIPLLHLMPIIALLLAEEDHAAAKERAVELYALAESHPFVAKAQLFEDIAARQIKAATAGLPPDVVKSAQERGRPLDWWETAEELVETLENSD